MSSGPLFRNKYRISSTRLRGWDYGKDAAYFVTICTKKNFCYFGEIENSRIKLSEIGKIVYDEWKNTTMIRPYVILDEFVVMPNHIHGIVIINKNDDNDVETRCCAQTSQDDTHTVETRCCASLQRGKQNWIPNKFGSQSHNLASIIRGFKSAARKRINSKFGQNHFAWQSRFHDRIVRNELELNKIRWYIRHNPKNWEKDNYY
ncbi:MAG: hypothetical protein GF349_03775 [Candidatus Magasanikbacteria bacterium]|nr:hypothetical protein [Candidatus Magasanikbacteria bacterium]